MSEPNFCNECETLYSGSKDSCPNCTPRSVFAEDTALEVDYEKYLPIVKNIWVKNLEREVIKRWISNIKNKTNYPDKLDFEIEKERNGWSKVSIEEVPLDKEKMEIINDLVESGAERVSFKRRDRKKTSLVTLTIRGERVVGVRPA